MKLWILDMEFFRNLYTVQRLEARFDDYLQMI